MKQSLLPLLLLVLFSCNNKRQTTLQIEQNSSDLDSLFLTELVTQRLITTIDARDTSSVLALSVDSPTVGVLERRNDRYNFHLVLLKPNSKTKLRVLPDSKFSSDQTVDSLLNYVSKSTNAFIGEHQSFIYNTPDTDSIVRLFELLRDQRRAVIRQHKDRLNEEEMELLSFQSEERINAFLLFFGRVVKKLSPDDSYFSFIDSIDENARWAKTLPDNILYKHEINYLLQNDSLTDISHFINYIDERTTNQDLFNFLKAYYIRELIESPSYWEKHQELFNTMVLIETIKAEVSNPYYSLFESAADNYFITSEGEIAFDFTAQKTDGTKVALSDFQGKIVFIDTWATWCGTCLNQKPQVYDLADKYINDPRVEVIFVSVDSDKERWENHIQVKDESYLQNNFWIPNGMRSEYGERYNIKSLPRYILIDTKGKIIHGNILEPSRAVVDMIEKELDSLQ